MENSLCQKIRGIHQDIISDLENKELLELDRMDLSFFISNFEDAIGDGSRLESEDFPSELAQNYAHMCIQEFGRTPLREYRDAVSLIESIPSISKEEEGWMYEAEKGPIFINENKLHEAPFFYLTEEFEKRYEEIEPYIEE